MSDRKTIVQAIKDFARHARNIRRLQNPSDINAHVIARLGSEGYLTKVGVNAIKKDPLIHKMAEHYVGALTVTRVPPSGKKEEQQLDLFVDLDQLFDVRHEVKANPDGTKVFKVKQKELGEFDLDDIACISHQKQENRERVLEEEGQWNRAKAIVVPLLQSHPGWVWKDAVEYLRKHGGIPVL
jgi:hypothetical protein